MTASGTAPRATLDLHVRVWGMGANGQAFHQTATAQNVSTSGALISGLDQELKVGDVIGVQFESKKARCKVVWVMDAGGLKKIQVGVQLVVDQECPWLSQLPAEMRVHAPGMRHDDRRRFRRHKISYPIELRDERTRTPMRLSASDVSGNGFYVETGTPLPVSTELRVDFFIDQEHVSVSATVRTCDPALGMGIELTGLPEEKKQRFQAHLEKLHPGIAQLGRAF